LTFDNSSFVNITGIAIIGGEIGIAFTFDDSETYSELIVHDCFFSGSEASSITQLRATGELPIRLGARTTNATVSSLSLISNLCISSDTFFVYNAQLGPGWTHPHIGRLAIFNNTLQSVSFNAVFVDDVDSAVVTGNVFLHDTPRLPFLKGTTDIILGSANANTRIIGNEIGWRGEFPAAQMAAQSTLRRIRKVYWLSPTTSTTHLERVSSFLVTLTAQIQTYLLFEIGCC